MKKSKRGTRKYDPVRPVMGIAWYRREQWRRLLEISLDGEGLEDTYDAWQVTAQKSMRKLSRHRYILRKIDIDVEELLSWCKSQRRPVDGKARSEFAAVKLRKEFKESK